MSTTEALKRETRFLWYEGVGRILREQGVPDLSGSRLLVVSDTREKDGYIIDSVLCTNEASMAPWEERRKAIRAHHVLGDHGLHYKELRPDFGPWAAVWPSLHSAAMLHGLAVVVRTPKALSDMNRSMIAGIQAQGLSVTAHEWKPHCYAEMVSTASLIALCVGLCSVEGQALHWLSDHNEAFRNPEQRNDMLNSMNRALRINVPHALGPTSISTPLLPEYAEDARDLVAIVDLFAGAVGDTMEDVPSPVNDDAVVWQPGENERRATKVGTINHWFFMEKGYPLRRRAFDLSYAPKADGQMNIGVALLHG